MENECAETPLIELLRDVPKDARLEIEVNPTHHKMIPVGVLCHNAAEKLAETQKNLDGWMLRAESVERLTRELASYTSNEAIEQLVRQLEEAQTQLAAALHDAKLQGDLAALLKEARDAK